MTPAPATLAANKAPNDIRAELRFADFFAEQSASAMTLYVPDCDGDANTE